MEDYIVRDCVQWTINGFKQSKYWIHKALQRLMPEPGAIMRIGDDIHVVTSYGIRIAYPTDYIIINHGNELYVCTEAEFKKEYE